MKNLLKDGIWTTKNISQINFFHRIGLSSNTELKRIVGEDLRYVILNVLQNQPQVLNTKIKMILLLFKKYYFWLILPAFQSSIFGFQRFNPIK